MSSTAELYDKLYNLFTTEKLIFCSYKPRDFDSTTLSKLALNLTFASKAGQQVAFTVTPDNTPILGRLFDSMVAVKTTAIIGHNLKDLFTMFARVNAKPLHLSSVYDLAWYESYTNTESSEGDTYLMISNFKCWLQNQKLINIYQKIYSPLLCHTLPSIESFSFLHEDINKLVFASYRLEGQENGRLSCICDKKRSYNPHSLGEEKKHLKLYNFGNTLYQFDYKNMEVSVLASLSKDADLLKIIHGQDDVYSSIFERVTGVKNEKEARNFGKKMFLPVIYGQTPSGLSKSLDISIDQAQIYFDKLTKLFPQAFAYVESFQSRAKDVGEVEDYFGRKRSLKTEEAYKARNFAIQSPAALICLEYLVKLDMDSKSLYKVAFHVHDGYYLACKQKDMLEVYHHAKKILESSSEFMPELKLNVAVKVGKSLDKMIEINRKAST